MKKSALAILLVILAVICCLIITGCGCGADDTDSDDDSGNYEIVKDLTQKNYTDYLTIKGKIDGKKISVPPYTYGNPIISVVASSNSEDYIFKDAKIKATITYILYEWDGFPLNITNSQTETVNLTLDKNGSAAITVDSLRQPYGQKVAYAHIVSVTVDSISGTVYVPCLHKWKDVKTVTAPTCTEAGLKAVVCEKCQKTQEIAVDALGHKIVEEEGIVTLQPTCIANGTKTYTCKTCKSTVEETLPSVEHTYDNGTASVEATCTTNGILVYTCLTCQGTKEEEIVATGHTYDEENAIIIEATCTTGGKIDYICTKCNTHTSETSDPLGHSYTTYTSVDATCTADAYEYAKCDNCEEIDTKATEGTALGHSYDENGRCTTCSTINPDLKVTSLEISNESFLVEVDEEVQVTFNVYPSNAQYDNVTYTIYQNNTCEAVLTEDGKLTCGKVGSVTIAVTIDGEITARATFYVPQSISTAEEFYNIRNDLSGVYILENDIDLSSYSTWTPIGNATKTNGNYDYTNAFSGKLDGNNFTVSGINLNLYDDTCNSLLTVGLFGSLSRDGQISNLNIKNVYITGSSDTTDYVGMLTGFNPGSIENCTVDGTINISSVTYVGGAIGENIGSAQNIEATATISASNNGNDEILVGGVVGRSTGGQISDVKATGDISVSSSCVSYVGGIAGNLLDKLTGASADVNITLNHNSSYSSDSRNYVGIIAGSSAKGFSDTTVDGSIIVTSYYPVYVGGVVGYVEDDITDCTNNATISLTVYSSNGSHLGGIAGYSSKGITNCKNTGTISVPKYSGGYVGGIAGEAGVISSCDNEAEITITQSYYRYYYYDYYYSTYEDYSTTAYVGGVAGKAASVSSSNNNSKIAVKIYSESSNYIGGVVGYSDGAVSSSTNKETGELVISDTYSSSSYQSQYFGGVVGCVNDSVLESENYGMISISSQATTYCGGIAGSVANSVSNAENHADVKATTNSILYCGGVAGYVTGSVSDAINNNSITAESTKSNVYCGGVVGYVVDVISNATNYANISAIAKDNVYCGGVAGKNDSTATNVKNLSYDLYAKSTSYDYSYPNAYVGGVLGYSSGDVTTASNTAKITVKSEQLYVGGVVGYAGSVTVSQASNSANIDVYGDYYDGYSYIGGVAGSASTIEKSYSTNSKITVAASSNVYVGGVVGNATDNVSLCYSYPDITVSNSLLSYVGGVSGYTPKITKSYSTSNLICNTTNYESLYIGGLSGYVSTLAEECYASSDVSGTSSSTVYMGGLIGYTLNDSNIKNCYAANGYIKTNSSSVSSSSDTYLYNGGLIGYNNGTVDSCYSVSYGYSASYGSANNHTHYIGGLVAYNTGNISKSYVLDAFDKLARTGLETNRDVAGSGAAKAFYAGGFVGYNEGSIENCYTYATVNTSVSGAFTGGFVGYNASTISKAIAYGEVNSGIAGDTTGGFAGGGDAGYSDCLFSTESSKQSPAIGNAETDKITASTNASLRTPDTFASFSTDIWNIVEGTYPQIKFGTVWENRTDGFNKYDMLLNVPNQEYQYEFPHSNRVTIKFDSERESDLLEDITTSIGTTIVLPTLENVVIDGVQYLFVGWCSDEERLELLSSNIIESVDASTTYYAYYCQAIDKPTTETFVYSGEEISVSDIFVNTDMYTITGDFAATNAGTYTLTFELAHGYCWSDGSLEYSLEWTIIPYTVYAPVIYDNGQYIFYTGTERDLSEEFASDIYTLTGDISITEIDDSLHTITISLNDTQNYIWSDETTDDKSYEYYIVTGVCGYNSVYKILDGVLTISGSGGIDNYYSTTAPWYENREEITSIVFSEEITSIGSYAFEGFTALTEITIPDKVISIASNAFSGCSGLTSITISNNVGTIGSGAFSGCSSLESITLPFVGYSASSSNSSALFGYIFGSSSYEGGVETTQNYYSSYYYGSNTTTYYIPASLKNVTVTGGSIPYGAFSGCSNLESITISDDDITSVGKYAFYNCSSLTSIELPDNLTSISEYAFSGCSALTSITIPDSVESIGQATFRGCSSLESITLPFVGYSASSSNSNALFGYIFGSSSYDGGVETTQNYYYYGSSTATYYIPASLKNVTITGGTIAYGAFSGCSSIEAITLGDDITSVGSYAFYNCSSLTSIELPDNLTSISEYAFSGCSALESIVIPDNVETINGSVFFNCTSLKDVKIPDSVTSIGSNAFYNCTSLESIELPSGLTNIAYYLFYGCSSLKSVNIPDSVTYIDTKAFLGCSSLESIEISDGVTTIYGSAFENCTALAEITIGAGVSSISASAFTGCTSLSTITVNSANESYKDIDGNLYSKDGTTFILYAKGKDDTTLDIPDGVTIINGNALSDCTLLESITVPSGVTSIYSSTFSGCTGLTSITLPNGLTDIGSSAFNGCSSLTSITLPDSLTSIESSAFNGCSSLTSITLPSGLISIEYSAFSGCSGITSIVVPDTVTSIGSGAFSGCSSLESITLPFVGNTASSSSYYVLFGFIFGSVSYDGGVEATQYYYNYGSSRSTTYYIPSSLKNVTVTGGSLNYGAFSGCSQIESITIGENVTSIGKYAFYNCTALKELNYNATTVYDLSSGNYTFYNVGNNGDGISVTIGNNVTTIPAYLFNPGDSSYSPNIVNVVFEDDSECESIGKYAFGYCYSLSSIEIPENITTISEGAFYYCTGLTEINFNATTMNDLSSYNYAFYYAGQNGDGITVTIGNNVTKIPAYLFYPYTSSSYAPNITNVVFEDNSSCASIGDHAFYYCSALERITIPDSIASIGRYAFYYCSALEQITIPDTVTSIGNRTFGYCSSLTIYCEVESAPNSWASDWNYSSCPVIWAIKDSGVTEDGFFWAQTVNDEIIIANYIGNNAILTIPNTINSLPVTSIAANAFYNCTSLIRVTIPSTITSIGNNAFLNCSKLVEVYDLTSLGITAGSSSNGYVGYYAKAVHTSLDDASILEVVDDFVFMTYDSTYYLVGYVGDDTEIALPESYKENSYAIYQYAFSGSSITGIAFPETVTSINSNAFNGCTNLTNATIPVSLISSVPNKATLQNVVITGCGSIPSQAFYGCSSLKSVTIGDEITSIGSSAFYDCYSLTSIEIPEGITSIESNAFRGCTNLTEIKFNATAMNDLSSYNYVFYNAGTSGTGITVTIGKNVTKIPACLFNPYEGSYVPRITSVVFEEESACESIGNYAFYYCTSLQSINIPDSVTSIGAYAFYYCSSLESIEIPAGITSISAYAFYNCSSLQSITIPENVTSIGNAAFYNCTTLTEINYNATAMNDLGSSNHVFSYAGSNGDGVTVTIGNNVTKIPAYLFYPYSSSSSYTPKITSVVFEEESVCESIGNYAFYNCYSLTSIELPQSVTSIGAYAFYYCSSLQSITIPENVTSIGNNAFYCCTYLTEIKFNAFAMDDLSSYNNVFRDAGCYSSGITVTIGENVTKIPDYLFNPYEGSDAPYITSVVFEGESACESIGSYAFYYANSLYSIVIPDSVTVIESYAFYGCSSLTIYCKAASQPTDWYYDWNASGRTVYWYSESEQTSGNYWHYDTDGNIVTW